MTMIHKAEKEIRILAKEAADKEIQKAVEVAKNLIETARLQAIKALGEVSVQPRYIDVSRVPLICQSIIGIDEKLESITKQMVTQDQFYPVKTVVYGLVSLACIGVVGSLLALVFKK